MPRFEDDEKFKAKIDTVRARRENAEFESGVDTSERKRRESAQAESDAHPLGDTHISDRQSVVEQHRGDQRLGDQRVDDQPHVTADEHAIVTDEHAIVERQTTDQRRVNRLDAENARIENAADAKRVADAQAFTADVEARHSEGIAKTPEQVDAANALTDKRNAEKAEQENSDPLIPTADLEKERAGLVAHNASVLERSHADSREIPADEKNAMYYREQRIAKIGEELAKR
jgi:hypothetical protein